MNYIIYGIHGTAEIFAVLSPIFVPAVIGYWYGCEKGKAVGFKRK